VPGVSEDCAHLAIAHNDARDGPARALAVSRRYDGPEAQSMSGDLEQFVRDAASTEPGVKERLFSAVYHELHQLAERQLRRNAGASISPTTLLHETYIELAGGKASFPDRNRFMGYAARVMRGLIIDFTRQRRALKRGEGFHITQINTQTPDSTGDETELLRLSEALDELALHDARLAEVVDLKYFCGFSLTEIAAMRAASERTVQRDWDKARLFLFGQLNDSSEK
jgi:RNA polymerase sigma factor (TIGR02999 family)